MIQIIKKEVEDWLKDDDEKAMTKFAFAVKRMTMTCHVYEGIRECVRIRTKLQISCRYSGGYGTKIG